MEQILLYIVTISGFSGFMLGLYSLLIPVLQRRGIRLPFTGRSDGDDGVLDYDNEDDDTLQFAANSFSARRGSLLDRLPRRGASSKPPEEEDDGDPDLDEELLGDLDLSRELAEVQAEDAEDVEEDEGDELADLTFEAEVDPVLEELAEDDDLGEEEDEDDEEGEEDDDEEYEDEEEETAEPQAAVIQVVPVGGDSNDLLSLFDEGSDVVKEIEAWRADLPDPTIEELLSEAQEISAMFKSRRPHA